MWGGFLAFTLGLFAMRIVTIMIKILDVVKEDPTILLSATRFFRYLKNDITNSSSSSRDSDNDKSSVHPTRKDNQGD